MMEIKETDTSISLSVRAGIAWTGIAVITIKKKKKEADICYGSQVDSLHSRRN